AAPSIAAALALAFGLPATRARVAALEVALVLSADHELNPSSFAARVAASAGADLYAAVGAAMATLSGPRHGGVAERVAAMLDEIGDPSRVVRVVQSRLRRGDPVVGFGHPLYPRGDPRVEPILAAARAVGGKKRRLRSLEAVVDAMALAGAPAPSYDIAITGLAVALGLGAAEATAIFAIGRSAGWIAHLLEQRQAGYILRPRARYTGSFPEGAL
ncbi:MAG: citrate synthase, partial [Myxococcales bacterium]|nr:citrate synthase [Myxococcales bacterium]